MARRSDIAERTRPGTRFGKLVVTGESTIRRDPAWKSPRRLSACLCDCGKSVEVVSFSLVSGNTKSCGCGAPRGNPLADKVRPGMRFSRLVVTGDLVPVVPPRGGYSQPKAPVRCDCGEELWVWAAHLVNGNTRSCGCLQAERTGEAARTHGESRSKLHWVWLGMKARCYYPRYIGYRNYGGRGITVCDEWREDFAAFRDWALANGYREGLSIDRKDNDGPYSPGNCRWVDRKTQCRNKQRNFVIEAFGESKTLADWTDDPRCRVRRATIQSRLNFGWSAEDAISLPRKHRGGRPKAIT